MAEYTYDQLTNALRNAGARARANPNDARAKAAAQKFASMIENQEYQQESSLLESAAQGIAQGATLGFHDEASAAVRATLLDPLVSAVFGKEVGGVSGLDQYLETMGERYDKALESQRKALETARREDPYTTMAGEFVGGLATGGAAVGSAVKGAKTTMQGIKEAAKQSAKVGAVAGAGYTEADPIRELTREGWSENTIRDFTEAATDMASSAALGATGGVVLPGATALARKLTRSVKNAFAPGASLTEEGKESIRTALARDIDSGYITSEEEALEMLRDTPGMSAADLGPHLRRVLKDVTASGTAAGTRAQQELTERNRTAFARVLPRLNKIIGTDKGYYKTLAEMQATTQKNAAAAYDQAYQTPIRISPNMERLLKTKAFKKTLKNVNTVRDVEGKPAIDKNLFAGQMRSTEELDDILQGMDDLVGQAYKKGRRLGNAMKEQRNAFRQELYDQNEDFMAARSQYGTDKSREEAMEMGRNIFREDVGMVKEMFDDMPQGDREDYIVGMMGAIEQQLKFKPDDADILKGLFNIEGRREIMRNVLGDENKVAEMIRFTRNEGKMFDTYKKAVPGTDTAENLMAAQTDQQGRVAGMITFMATKSLLAAGMAGRAARLAGRDVGPSPRQQYAREQQRQMILGGVEGLERAMQRPGGLLAPGPQPVPAAITGGLMATGIPQQGVEYGGY